MTAVLHNRSSCRTIPDPKAALHRESANTLITQYGCTIIALHHQAPTALQHQDLRVQYLCLYDAVFIMDRSSVSFNYMYNTYP